MKIAMTAATEMISRIHTDKKTALMPPSPSLPDFVPDDPGGHLSTGRSRNISIVVHLSSDIYRLPRTGTQVGTCGRRFPFRRGAKNVVP